jgi:hypothetical protein
MSTIQIYESESPVMLTEENVKNNTKDIPIQGDSIIEEKKESPDDGLINFLEKHSKDYKKVVDILKKAISDLSPHDYEQVENNIHSRLLDEINNEHLKEICDVFDVCDKCFYKHRSDDKCK